MNTGLVIAAPASIEQFCKQMEATSAFFKQSVSPINKALNATTSALTNALADINRAQKFIVEQYEKSPLAKKRKAKANLCQAINAALASARKTLREVAQSFTEQVGELILSLASPPSLSNYLAANAPNGRATHRNKIGSTRALTLERIVR